MLKELSFPGIFSAPRVRAVKVSGIKPESRTRKLLVIVLAALNAGLLFAYIADVNTRASAGYEIKSLENKIQALSQDNKKLMLQISEKASVANLQTELLQNGFSFVKSSEFLQADSQYTLKH